MQKKATVGSGSVLKLMEFVKLKIEFLGVFVSGKATHFTHILENDREASMPFRTSQLHKKKL